MPPSPPRSQPPRFELELLGGAIEKRYRRARPEVEEMPWGTLDLSGVPEHERVRARLAWTSAAYQEHRTGVGVTEALRLLMQAQAPLDLIALGARFPLDETVHVELCARLAMEAGGGTEILYDPRAMILGATLPGPPLLQCAELMVRFFCVGEALSIPLLRGTWKAARHPLPRAVLGRIVKDEAAHGTFGYLFLDWAEPQLSREDRRLLGLQADLAIDAVVAQWDDLRARPKADWQEGNALAWMQTEPYLELAARSMNENVLQPLRERDIPVSRFPNGV
ncbi:MAG TPA: hypothetical protein VFS67_22035 [Polyangiaceae bacterium]|nr:hypothetical protein [Polyangiaceae bacterium]